MARAKLVTVLGKTAAPLATWEALSARRSPTAQAHRQRRQRRLSKTPLLAAVTTTVGTVRFSILPNSSTPGRLWASA